MLRLQNLFTFLLVIIVSLTAFGCGGGSEGTGTLAGSGRTLVGTLRTPSSTPVAGAMVTLLGSGDTAVTDNSGSFSLALDQDTSQVTLEVESNQGSGQVEVGSLDTDATKVSVDLTVSQQGITSKNIQIWARIVGFCDPYFENLPIIRQSNKVTGPVLCTTKFFASGDGQRLANVPAAIQVRACGSRVWTTIAQGKTGFGAHAGVGQISFAFEDDLAHCEYRVVAPFQVSNVSQLSIFIETLTFQSTRPKK